jgi:outer membrane receptor protein involved in Fe transport
MRILFIILLLCSGISGVAQHSQGGGEKGGNSGKGEIFGNILDSLSNDPLGYATIKVFDKDGKLIGGALSEENGDFTIKEIPPGNYKVTVSFAGYAVRIIEDVQISESNNAFQIKDITIAPTTLNTVEVVGGNPEITYEIDKKIVHVEDQQNTDGLTALEVLENVPSISVSSDGTVSLRGSSSFTLLIDGIPTVLDPSDALALIPASTIQDIEIITNPSAKFDAEGTAGVINIITKKSKLQGMNGILNGTVGRFDNYSADGSLNIKREKFAFDVTGNYGQRSNPNDKTTDRTTIYDSLTNRLLGVGVSDFKRKSWNFGAGFQWNPNSAHNFVIRSSYGKSLLQFENNMDYTNYDDNVIVSSFNTDARLYIPISNFSNSLFYQYNIKRNREHYISFKAIANLKYVNQEDSTLSYDENNTLIAGNLYTEDGPSNLYRFNLDYHLPVKKKYRFESGVQAQFGQSGDIGKNYEYIDSTKLFELNPLFSSDVDYIRNVYAAYSMFGGQVKSFGFQVGMRMEYTFRRITSSQSINFTEINRPDWFPSAHLSYSLKNKSQLLLSYSRRIKRPRSWYFEPFITWTSPFNVRSGNPNLQPTYINNFEVSYMQPLKQKGFYSFEGYYRINSNIVNWISSVYQEGILISNPFNIGTSQSVGVEGMLDYSLTKWYKLNLGFNTYYFNLDGAINDVDYSTNSFNWNVNLRQTFDLKGWMIQLNTRYRSGSVTAQGNSLDIFTADISLRKSFFKKRLSFNLQGRNLFLTARESGYTYIENVTIFKNNVKQGPYVSLTVSVKLNNYQKFYEQENLDDF